MPPSNKKTSAPETPAKAAAANRERLVLFGFLAQVRGSNGRLRLRVRWGQTLIAAVLLFAFAWTSVATLLFFYFKHKHDFADVTFGGMMTLPFRMDEHRLEMGTFHIEEGLAALAEGDGRTAFGKLRVGVARAPSHLIGRTALSELFEFGWRRPDLAAEAMVDGLRHGGSDDLEYVRRTVALLLRHQMDERVQEIADRYLGNAQSADAQSINQILAFGAARANHYRGNYDRAENLLRDYNLMTSVDGILLSAQISWDRDNQMAAISRLEDALRTFGNSEAIFLQLSRYHRERGELDQARRYAILRNASNPLAIAPRIELLYIYQASGATERAEREAQQVLRQFREDEAGIAALANFAADAGNVPLARRIYQLALESEFAISTFTLLLIEAHLVAKDFQGAIDFTEELVRENPAWLEERGAVFFSLRAVASYAIGRDDLAQIYLQNFLSAPDVRVETYLAVSRRLNEVNRPREAQRVLSTAYRRNPGNQSALSELIRIELALGNSSELPVLLRRLLSMRRPSTEIISQAYESLGSDRFIFASDRETLLLELGAALRESNVRIPSA